MVFSAIGLVTGLFSSIIIEKPNDEGWLYQVVKNGFTISLDYRDLLPQKSEEE